MRAGGVDLTEAILREEVYERLIGELEREDVSSDARDAVASFLQDLRRDGVEWHSSWPTVAGILKRTTRGESFQNMRRHARGLRAFQVRFV